MKREKQKTRKTSLSGQRKRILLLSALLIAVDVLVSLMVVRDIKNQNSQYLSNMAELYIQEQDSTFFKLSRQMLSILTGDGIIKSDIRKMMDVLEESEDPLEQNVARSLLKNDFLEYTWDYGTDYKFFAFFEEKDLYMELNSIGVSEPEMEAMFRKLKGTLNDYSAKAKWTDVYCESGSYIMKVMHSGGRYLGCYIRADALLKPLEELNFADRGFAALLDEQDLPVAWGTGAAKSAGRSGDGAGAGSGSEAADPAGSMGEYENKEEEMSGTPEVLREYLERGGRVPGYLVIEKSFGRAPFRVLVFVNNRGLYERYLAIQVALIALGGAILATLILINQYLQHRVLEPIQKFADNLLRYDGSDQLVFDITSNELKELEQANEQFRNLLRQIKRLKITLYEKELERQEIQMDYLQLQIKPHFYLNCLNFVYQMVDMGEPELAKRMAAATSDYLRYLFQSSVDFVKIEHELRHVENYLEIQRMRYQNAFTYYIEQEEETREFRIPPLMLQTFAENGVHHAVSLDRPVEITILVCEEERDGEQFANITISDTGTGFPPEVLEALSRGERLPQTKEGHRVGITNCLRRLQYFYQGRGWAGFYNNPMGGAVVELHLPKRVDGKGRGL